jgi:hypothetical protein
MTGANNMPRTTVRVRSARHQHRMAPPRRRDGMSARNVFVALVASVSIAFAERLRDENRVLEAMRQVAESSLKPTAAAVWQHDPGVTS